MTNAQQIISTVEYTFVERWSKMSAKQQREVFGAAVFGKKTFCYNRQRRMFEVAISADFGRDEVYADVTPEMVAQAVNTGKTIEYNSGYAFLSR